MDYIRRRLPHNIIKDYTNVEANEFILNNIIDGMLHIIGLVMTKPGPAMNVRTWIVFLSTHLLVVSFIFMVFSDMSLSEKLEGFCIFVIIYQGLHKLYTSIIMKKYYIKCVTVLRDLHMNYLDDPAIGPFLKKISFYCVILFEIILVLYYTVMTTYIMLPIFMWKQFNVLTTILPIPFPFIDWHTPVGYTSNMINHFISVIAGPTGIVIADFAFMYLVIHSIGYIEILKHRVAHLDELLVNQPQDIQKIQKQLYKCIQAHQDYISYVEMVDEGYAQLCFSQLMTSELALTMALFLTVWSNWFIGPFLVIAGLFQLLEYCCLGTVVTVQNERAAEIIYGMKWYLLPPRHQKLVSLMILRGQNSPELNVGGFAKLNVATAQAVLNTTYSYLMMMLEFVN